MASIYERRLDIPLHWAIVCLGILLILVFGALTYLLSDKPLLSTDGPVFVFVSGMVPGLMVALVQFFLSWREFKEISTIRRLGVENMLPGRNDTAYYARLLQATKEEIWVMGTTASRFVNDFADPNSTVAHGKILIEALQRGVKVKILVPSQPLLSPQDQQKYPIARSKFEQLVAGNYTGTFEVRYSPHMVIAAIVRADDDMVVGPIFPQKESKNTPAIHTKLNTAFAESYKQHFDAEWDIAQSL